jgi:hypothetical protein
MSNTERYPELSLQQVWNKNGITYVPHYYKPNVFVGPGYAFEETNYKGEKIYVPKEYKLSYLLANDAVAEDRYLWKRTY